MVSPSTSLLFVENLRKYFPIGIGFPPWQPAAHVRAVDNISFDVSAGETLGVVGESGCGKSTMARLLIHLIEPDTGDIKLNGLTIGAKDGIPIPSMRSQVQMVFQDSYASLNPRMPIEESIAFGPISDGVSHKEAMERSIDLMAKVGLEPAMFLHRYPHELSGGQRQRVNIARALAMQPHLLILDEATSQLDSETEEYIREAISNLHNKITIIIVAHRLSTVKKSDIIYVLDNGKIV